MLLNEVNINKKQYSINKINKKQNIKIFSDFVRNFLTLFIFCTMEIHA